MTKEENQKSNGLSNRNGQHVVHVEFSHPTATAVAIAGTFNDWRPEATPMVDMGQGRWLKELVLPPGTYEYLFVVDGRWLVDPLARATTPNPFGGVNSVVTVPKEAFARTKRKSVLSASDKRTNERKRWARRHAAILKYPSTHPDITI